MKTIRNLSLSGGGNYGFAHIAALSELEKFSDKIQIENIVGVSCGSIVGALYAVGYQTNELKEIFFEMDLDSLVCDSSWIGRLYMQK